MARRQRALDELVRSCRARTRDWAALVYPELDAEAAYERLWARALARPAARRARPDGRLGRARRGARGARRGARPSARFDAIELRGPGHRAHGRPAALVGLVARATSRRATACATCRTSRRRRSSPRPTPSAPRATSTSTRPLVLKDGTIVRGLRVRFEGGRAVEIDADENAEALRAKVAIDEGAARLGELALVDRRGPHRPDSARSSTTRCSTRTPRATSRSATAYRVRASDDERPRAPQPERDPHRLHDRLARARGDRRHAATASACRCCAAAPGSSPSREPYDRGHGRSSRLVTISSGAPDLGAHGIDACTAACAAT